MPGLKGKTRYSFTVELFQSDKSVTVGVGVNHHVATLVTEALARMDHRYNPRRYALYDAEGNRIRNGHTIGSADLEDGATLTLARNTKAV